MAELKHTFTSGRMNKDLDDRLIPNGEYTDALNIQVSSSEGSDVGAIENLLGNELLTNLDLINAKTIGSIADTKTNKIYWIVTSDNIDAIYEYDEKTNEVKAILSDEKSSQELTIKDVSIYPNADGELSFSYNNNFSTAIGAIIPQTTADIFEEYVLNKNNIDISSDDIDLNISVPKNTTVLNNKNKSIEFKNISYSGLEYGNIDIKLKYSVDGYLNFSKNNLITGINIIDGILFWTDNLNEPRRINISDFRSYQSTGNQTQIPYKTKKANGEIVINYRPIQEEDITVAVQHPLTAPYINVVDTNLGAGGGAVSISKSIDFSNNSAGDSVTITVAQIPVWEVGQLIVFTTDEENIEIQGVVEKITDKDITFTISTISAQAINGSHNFLINAVEKDPIYELSFVRFAYRWKYKNGEYSVFSPFTVPAFFPNFKVNTKEFKYDGKEGFNYGMVNQTRKISLQNIDTGSDAVEEIEIIFKETKNNNVYVLEKSKKIDFDATNFEITKEQIESIVANDQLLRQWDNVPRKAKAQEITANRVIYGNYIQNYDIYNQPKFEVKIGQRSTPQKYTVKSNRTYQLGVVYSDKYNRQSPVMSNSTGSIVVPKTLATNQNQLIVNSQHAAPAWATHFRYFIKENSGEYYNLAVDRFYQDEENGFTYVSFPSSERNKITEEHYLLLKKNHGDNNFVDSETNRYKIIDISAEPPEFITARKRGVISLGDIVFTDDYGGSNGGNTITNKSNAENNAPIKDFASIQIKQANSSADGVELTDAKEIKPGRFIVFEYLGKESKAYKIKRLSQHPSGDNEIKIDFEEPFDKDVEIIYNKTSGNLGDASTNFGVNINILEEYSAAGDKEFDGRFFVKLKTNNTLNEAIVKQSIGGVEYLAKESIPLIGVYSSNDDKGTGRRGENTYKNLNRIKDNASKDPTNKFVVSDGGTASPGSTPESGKRVVKGSYEYNITLESATENLHSEVDSLLKKAKVGNFVRFVNPDQTPHHDTVYEIGAVATDTFETSFGASGLFKAKGKIKRIHFRFIDEDGNFKPLDQDVVSRGQDTWGEEPQMEILEERNNEQTIVKEPAIFETEPLESKTDLNIYYEISDAFEILTHTEDKKLNWYNAISFGNGVESNRIRDDFNATFIDNGVKASTVLDEPFAEEHKFNGLIWSGILNSRSGINKTNQFNMANPITKDLLPSYGSIQKLHAWDDSMVILCEDKTLRVLANKSALYNADGSANLISDSRVIGDPIEYNGEFGIGTLPETFASYGFRCYFADKARGVILRLSKDGLTPISKANMSDFFRDRLFNATTLFGSYDSRRKLYNISFTGEDTVCFSEDVQGWPSRLSFIPENSVYLNNVYYTYNNGELWKHHSTEVLRNNFYGEQYKSHVNFVINDNPSVIKKFKTLGYEGTSGWTAKEIKTDQVNGNEATFIAKENKYFANITQEAKLITTLDHKNISSQGIGRSVRKTNADGTQESDYSDTVGNQVLDKFNVKVIDSESFSSSLKKDIIINPDNSITDTQITLFPNKGYIIEKTQLTSPSDLITFENSGDNVTTTVKGSYLESLSPSNGDTKNITITGKAVLAPVKISGSYTIEGFNMTDDKGNDSFSITNDVNTTQVIVTRLIKPNDGYYINESDITVDNGLVQLEKNKLDNGNIEITERITVPKVETTGITYKITVTPHEIIIPPKQLYSSDLDTSDLDNDGENRFITILGDVGAEYEIIFSDTSNTITTDKVKLIGNEFKTKLEFPADDTAETYTVKIEAKDDTIFNTDFGDETFTIERKARSLRDITFSIDASGVVTTANSKTIAPTVVSGYDSDEASINFKYSITLDGTGYSLAKTPTFNDLEFSSNITGTNIVFDDFTLTTAANDTLVFRGTLTSANFNENEFFILRLDLLLEKDVTVTFAYSKTIAGGSATSNYTVAGYNSATIPYTITAPASKIYTPQRNYYWTFTAASGYKPKKTFTNLLPFKIYDSSNTDVTDTFAFNDKVSYGKSGSVNSGQFSVGFKNKSFKFPSSNQTYTIRPTEEIYEANSGTEIRALIEFPTQFKSTGFSLINGAMSFMTISTYGKGLTSRKFNRADDGQMSFRNLALLAASEGVKAEWRNSSGAKFEVGYQYQNRSGNAFSMVATGRYYILDATAGNKLLQHKITLPNRAYYWWDSNLTDTTKYNLTNLGSYFTKASSGTYTDIYGDSKTITGTFELDSAAKVLTINMLVNFNGTDVGNAYYAPELLTSITNDKANYFTKYKAKVGTKKHFNNPCDLVLDDTVDFIEVLSPSDDFKDGDILYHRDDDGDLIMLDQNIYPIYLENNGNLLYGDKTQDSNVAGATNKIVPIGHASTIQLERKYFFEDTNCSTVKASEFPTVIFNKGQSAHYWYTSSPNQGLYIWREWQIINRQYANKEIKIRGTYYDRRYAHYANVSRNAPNNFPGRDVPSLSIVTTPDYPNGVPGVVSIETMELFGNVEIIDASKNIWEATVQMNASGTGYIRMGAQIYSNITAPGIFLESNQITNTNGFKQSEMGKNRYRDASGNSTAASVAAGKVKGPDIDMVLDIPAYIPRPKFTKFNRTARRLEFEGSYESGKIAAHHNQGAAMYIANYPTNSSWPTMWSINNGDARTDIVKSAQWTTPYDGDLTLPNKI